MNAGGLLLGSASFIAWCALLISFVSIYLSVLNYKKDRWKLSLKAWIEAQVPSIPNFPKAIRGRLFVETKNIGRRTLTIEGIALQVFEDELEEIRKTEFPHIEKVERIGFVAYFMRTQTFPVQLTENDPMTVTIGLVGLDPLSRKRFCVVDVTGRRKPITIRCYGGSRQPKPRYFSGS